MTDEPTGPGGEPGELMLRGAHPVLGVLRAPVGRDEAAAVTGWLDRREHRTDVPAGLADDLDDLAVWLDVEDPVLVAARLVHLLATCLVPACDGPGPDPDVTQIALELARRTGTGGADRQAASAVLLVALGAVPSGSAAAVWFRLRRTSGPAELTGAVAALRVVSDHVHASFGVPELRPGVLLEELVSAGHGDDDDPYAG